jgi:hypothetical protein
MTYANHLITVPYHYKSGSAPTLAEVLAQKITWSSDPSSACGYNDPVWPGAFEICRGTWAGDRFDVVDEDFPRDGKPWVDVGEKVIREAFQLYRDDGWDIKDRDR